MNIPHMHHLGWGGLFVFITCFFIGLFVYLKDTKNLLNRAWAAVGFSVAIFGFGFFKVDTASSSQSALFWWKFMYVGVIFIAPSLIHFTFIFLGVKNRKVLYFIYPASVIFLIFNLFSPLYFRSVTWKFNNIWYADAGSLFIYFALLWWGTVGYSMYVDFKVYKKSTGIKRNQIRYWILAMIVGFFGGVFCYLPIFNINIYPYTIYLVGIWPLILTVAIIKYRLWEIDTVIHRTLLWVISLSAMFIPIFTIIYFLRDPLHNMSRFNLSISLTVLSLPIFYYYRTIQPKIDHAFRRRKYDYQTILGKVAEKIATTIDIEDLTRKFLAEVCETMYLRNSLLYVLDKDEKGYSLIGRRGYKEGGAIGQRTDLVIFNAEERDRLPESQKGISCDSLFCQWLSKHQDILEKIQVEANPQYQKIQQEALVWFKEQDLELVVPLIFENKVNALLGLGKKENLQAYTIRDIQLLKKLGQEAGVTVFNALHYKDLAEKERLDEEMKTGRQIQMALLPRQRPQTQGLIVHGLMQPAREIGGDYYDFITLPDKEKLAIVIGDVSGKGVAAGLLMAMAKTAIHTLSREETSPREILLRTNQILNQHVGGQKFMTLLYLLWKPQAKTFTYSSAGHEHILFYHHQTQVLETIQSGGFMLGVLENIDSFIEEKEILVNPKDKILLYTDGVTEAENQQGDRFSLDRLKEVFKTHCEKPAPEFMQAIKDEVYAFIGNYPQYDDITLVVMEAT